MLSNINVACVTGINGEGVGEAKNFPPPSILALPPRLPRCTPVRCTPNINALFFVFIGRRQLLKCLLEIHALCREEDPWFLLNELYLTDYCVWIQKAR